MRALLDVRVGSVGMDKPNLNNSMKAEDDKQSATARSPVGEKQCVILRNIDGSVASRPPTQSRTDKQHLTAEDVESVIEEKR